MEQYQLLKNRAQDKLKRANAEIVRMRQVNELQWATLRAKFASLSIPFGFLSSSPPGMFVWRLEFKLRAPSWPRLRWLIKNCKRPWPR